MTLMQQQAAFANLTQQQSSGLQNYNSYLTASTGATTNVIYFASGQPAVTISDEPQVVPDNDVIQWLRSRVSEVLWHERN